MSFVMRNLCVLSYANGFTLWHYKTSTDTLQNIVAHDFFSSAEDMLAQGDMLLISAADGASIVSVTSGADSPVVVAPVR